MSLAVLVAHESLLAELTLVSSGLLPRWGGGGGGSNGVGSVHWLEFLIVVRRGPSW